MGLAERADVIVDFTNVPVGNYVLGNVGPDEPFGGGVPGRGDFDAADPDHRPDHAVQCRAGRWLPIRPPHQFLCCRPIVPLPPETVTRPLALIEKMGMGYDADGEMVEALSRRSSARSIRHWPSRSTVDGAGHREPGVGATEVWEFYNTTGDAHPMHVHEVVFEVVNREGLCSTSKRRCRPPIQLGR
jgi:spore coat protein A, manganese oxidase